MLIGLLGSCGPQPATTPDQSTIPVQPAIPPLPADWTEARGASREDAWNQLIGSVGQVYRGVSQIQNLVEESSLNEFKEYTRSQAEGRTESVGYLEHVQEYKDGAAVILRVPQRELTRLGLAKSINSTYFGTTEDPRIIQEIYTKLYFINAPRRFEPILTSRFWGGAKAFYLDDLKEFVFWNQGGNIDRVYTILQVLSQDQYAVKRSRDRILTFAGIPVSDNAFTLLRNALAAYNQSGYVTLGLLEAYRSDILGLDLIRQNALDSEIRRLQGVLATNVPSQIQALRQTRSQLPAYLAPLGLDAKTLNALVNLWNTALVVKVEPNRIDLFKGHLKLSNLPERQGQILPLAIDKQTGNDAAIQFDGHSLTNFSVLGKQYLRLLIDVDQYLQSTRHTRPGQYLYLNALAPSQTLEYTTTLPLEAKGDNRFNLDLSTDDQDLIIRITGVTRLNQGYHYYFCNLLTAGADRGKIELLPFRNSQGLPLTEANWRNGFRTPKSGMQGHWDFIMLASKTALNLPDDHMVEPAEDFARRIAGQFYTYSTASIQVN